MSKEELAASEEKHKATIGELTARIAQLEHEVKLLEVRIDNLPQRSDFVDLQGTVNNLSREIGSLKAVSEANQRTLSRIDDYLLNGHRA